MSCHRLLVLCFVLLAGASTGCNRDQRPLLNTPAEENERPAEVDVAPMTVVLQTDRPHVIRLIEPQEIQSTGRFIISSTNAGVMISLDSDAPVPLPATLDVPPGPHTIRAICPDSSTETLSVRIDSDATVRLRVCEDRNP